MALEIVVRQSTLGAAHQALNAMDRNGKKCLKPKLLRLLDRLCKCLVTYQLFTFFPADALFWGWGQYDTWTRRRTVLDLIRLTYYEAFKTELLRDAAGDEAADWGMLDFRVDMVSSVAPTEWKVDGFLMCLRLIVHRGCGKHGLSFPMSSKRVGLKRWISQFARLHFSVTCVCIDVRCAIAIDFKMV